MEWIRTFWSRWMTLPEWRYLVARNSWYRMYCLWTSFRILPRFITLWRSVSDNNNHNNMIKWNVLHQCRVASYGILKPLIRDLVGWQTCLEADSSNSGLMIGISERWGRFRRIIQIYPVRNPSWDLQGFISLKILHKGLNPTWYINCRLQNSESQKILYSDLRDTEGRETRK